MATKKAGKYRLPKNYVFPKEKQVKEMAGMCEGLAVNGEEQFSSRALTDWYVQTFLAANHLKH